MESALFKTWFKIFAPITLLAFAAGLQMFGALLFFRTPPDFILVIIYTVISFSIYLLNRFTDEEDNYNCPEQKIYFQKKSILISVPITLILLSFLLLAMTSRLTFWHIVLIVCGVFYSVAIVPSYKNRTLTFLRLKDIIVIKNISVSLLWGITPFAIAASRHAVSTPPLTDLIIVAFAFCLTTLINTTSCDVRDIDGDRFAGVKTLATELGRNLTGQILLGLAILGCITVTVLSLRNLINSDTTILFFATVIWTTIVAIPIYSTQIKLPKVITEPLIDTQQILCGIMLVVISVIV